MKQQSESFEDNDNNDDVNNYEIDINIDSELFNNDLDDLDFDPHLEEDLGLDEDIYGYNN